MMTLMSPVCVCAPHPWGSIDLPDIPDTPEDMLLQTLTQISTIITNQYTHLYHSLYKEI